MQKKKLIELKFKLKIKDTIHNININSDVKERARMYALQSSELHEIVEAVENPDYIREKSSIVS